MSSTADITCSCEEEEVPGKPSFDWMAFKWPIVSSILFIIAIVGDAYFDLPHAAYIAILLTSYILVAWDVLKKAFKLTLKFNIFNEFVLMSVATFGAFYIGEYLEGVFVM